MYAALHGALLIAVAILMWTPSLAAQQLIDRVMARVNGYAITLSDVRAAVGLGVVEVPAGQDAEQAGLQAVIDRQLMEQEVARFPPPEPEASAIASQLERQKAFAGSRFATVVQSSGLSDAAMRELARQTLRIRAYLDQRFGASAQVSDQDAQEYFKSHPDEFRRNGVPMSFDEAEPLARERAAAERRTNAIAQWVRDLRTRAEVVMPAHR